MIELEGVVDNIIFKNETNGYCVLDLKLNGEEENTTVVGSFYDVNVGDIMSIKGEYVEHLIYGSQFKMSSYKSSRPKSLDGIKAYLASGAVPHVKTALATKIIAEFGEKSLEIMQESPEILSEKIKGITLKRAQEISVVLQQNKKRTEAVIFMQEYDISSSLAVKLYEKYSDKIYEIIKTNPYEIAYEQSSVSFKISDQIALKAGISKDSEFRIYAGIIFALKAALNEGHSYLPTERLKNDASKLLELNVDDIEHYIKELIFDKKLVGKIEGGISKIYLPYIFYMEKNIAVRLSDLNLKYEPNEERLLKKIDTIQKEDNITFDKMQTEAVLKALKSGLLVITGGAGTGKTTVLKTIIKLYENEGLKVSLAAPTGRAAKRMTEATGRESLTVHRLLEARGSDNENTVVFDRNEDNPLESGLIIIDEMSMVDLPLMNSLLRAVPIGSRLILTGDANQLSSVGVGNVLNDIISSGEIEVITLKKIFRQSNNSNIVTMAHDINKGLLIEPKILGSDFIFLEREDAYNLKMTLLTMIMSKLPKAFEIDAFDIQVLCPMKRGQVGVEEMNRLLQFKLNPPDDEKCEHISGDIIYREGDKVMQIKNNYQIDYEIRSKSGFVSERGNGIFNGDQGKILKINRFSATMTILFDSDRYVEYPFNMLEQLELSYAITVHKSQGSEFEVIILPLFDNSNLLMTRNILYTAVTRGKKCVCILGRKEVFCRMIENVGDFRRFSSLDERIREAENISRNN